MPFPTTTLKLIQGALPYGHRFSEYRDKFPEVDLNSAVEFDDILERCGLEPALFAIRTISIADWDKSLRSTACDVVEEILGLEKKSYHNDLRPYEFLEITRKYIEEKLLPQEVKDFESEITFKRLMQKRIDDMSEYSPAKFTDSLIDAAIWTTEPNAKLAIYFSVLNASVSYVSAENLAKVEGIKIKHINRLFNS